jgi:3-deoxy-D-manno-octulosonic-acid transferase
MGPSYVNFRAITDDLIAGGALRIADKNNLASVLCELLTNRDSARAMGERARQLFEQQAGATARSLAAIRKLLRDRNKD